ncbi:MAG: carbon-nitrogen hydrolase family protein [Chloroflexi bacterium]|nr:carbon-nitrogen hydrolase family protein [Chloroflexota bacterium]
MPRTVTAAAVRLSNEPAPTADRLQAAEAQVLQAAQQGAQLVVLPEVFNTGYEYSDENYTRAEPLGGPTVTWMKHLAAEHNVHLAGSLLLLDTEHITNSLLLVAPDGRTWRYNKNYPWVWERLYFREGHDITVAETDIGTFGLLICADVVQPRLFQRYAGRVDALIIAASPPQVHNLALDFPDDTRLPLDMAPTPGIHQTMAETFDGHVRRSTAWLGVPAIQSIPYGQFKTRIPLPWISLGILLGRTTDRWRYIPQGKNALLTGPFYTDNQIVDASGDILARYDAEADGFALATVELADERPQPSGKPPRYTIPIPHMMIANALAPLYRRGVRRAWGRNMAPVDQTTRYWQPYVLGALISGFVWGRMGGGHKRRRKEKTPAETQES